MKRESNENYDVGNDGKSSIHPKQIFQWKIFETKLCLKTLLALRHLHTCILQPGINLVLSSWAAESNHMYTSRPSSHFFALKIRILVSSCRTLPSLYDRLESTFDEETSTPYRELYHPLKCEKRYHGAPANEREASNGMNKIAPRKKYDPGQRSRP